MITKSERKSSKRFAQLEKTRGTTNMPKRLVRNTMTCVTTANSPVSGLAADLTFYPAHVDDPSSRPLVLVLPGGGYGVHAEHENGVVAEWLAELGLNALVLLYAVAPARFPDALVRVREVLAGARSGELGLPIDSGRIAVLGFSAGGHLAATASSGLAAFAGVDAARAGAAVPRPDLAILAYPVISLLHEPHQGSVANLLGPDSSEELRRALSAENLVDAGTPPTFLWHTSEDDAVRVSHSLGYASALAAQRIPLELHVFEPGGHGLGLAEGRPPVNEWTALCAAWLRGRGWID
jgi:acetyl esterase/lipase